MKIIRKFGHGFMVCADTARANRGEPIHFPSRHADYTMTPCLAVRMSGVCRCVDATQALGYVDALTAAFHFCNITLREALREEGAPLDAAYSYDRSVVVGGYSSLASLAEQASQALSLHVGNEALPLRTLHEALERVPAAIEQVTQHVRLNTGDYLLLPLGEGERKAERRQRYSFQLGDRYVLDEYVS